MFSRQQHVYCSDSFVKARVSGPSPQAHFIDSNVFLSSAIAVGRRAKGWEGWRRKRLKFLCTREDEVLRTGEGSCMLPLYMAHAPLFLLGG